MSSQPDAHDDVCGRHLLPSLFARVSRARSQELHELRQVGGRAQELRAARLDTLLALRDYAGAIEALHWPVPRAIQQDIRLHRALLGPAVTS
jgi:hypothetical protein